MKLKGDKELIRVLERLKSTKPIKTVLYQEAEEIMGDSKANYVPVDVGTLRASGHVQLPEERGRSIIVRLGYGGAAKDYALVQHENATFRHKVGQAKYLERPMLSAANGMPRRLAARLRPFLERP